MNLTRTSIEPDSKQDRRPFFAGWLCAAIAGISIAGCQTPPKPTPPTVVSLTIQNRSMANIARAAQTVFIVHGYQGGPSAPREMVFQGMGGSLNNLTDDTSDFDRIITVQAVLTFQQVDANSVLVTCTASVLDAGVSSRQPAPKLRSQPFLEILHDIAMQAAQ
jgi:hypothetical protein